MPKRRFFADDETGRLFFWDSQEEPPGALVEEISAFDWYVRAGACACGKKEMDGKRCALGATHKTLAMSKDEDALS